MNRHRSFSRALGATTVVSVALALALAGCEQHQNRSSAASVPAAVARPASASGGPAAAGAPATSLPSSSTTTSPMPTVAPSSSPTISSHSSVQATSTTQTPATTAPVSEPSGPAPATPGTYYYRQVGSLPGTPAQGTLVVAPVSASGTQVWTRSVGGPIPPVTSVMLFNTSGSYLVSPGNLVTGGSASCTFPAPVPWPSWPTTVGQAFSAQATCTGGVSFQVSGHVEGTATESLGGQSVNTAVVVNTFAIKGDVDGHAFNVTLTETDYYAPALRVPVLTQTTVAGTAVGFPISTSRTDALVSATPS